MIDLLNRIGFRQIAFGGESSGGSGSGRTDGPDETLVTRGDSYAYDPYEDADLYDAGGYQQEYSGSNYGGSSNNSMFDADMLSKVTRGLGTSTTWVGNNTQEAYNVDQNNV